MFDVEEVEDSGSVVGDGGVSAGGDHFVHASGTYVSDDVPKVVLTISTMASMALILEMICPMPSIESVPSRRRRMVGCLLDDLVPEGGSSSRYFKKI